MLFSVDEAEDETQLGGAAVRRIRPDDWPAYREMSIEFVETYPTAILGIKFTVRISPFSWTANEPQLTGHSEARVPTYGGCRAAHMLARLTKPSESPFAAITSRIV